MNPYLHLMWKEYRAVRLFWMAVVVLAVGLEFLIVSLADNVPQLNAAVWGMAFGAPVLFAFGCAGASFAVEKEEGTINFLQAAPVTSQQLVVSKLTIAALATAGMFVALWALGLLVMRGRAYDPSTMLRILAVAGVTSLDAIAWGTLFSLVFARPLVAVLLAFAAASTVVHVLVFTSIATKGAFRLEPYLAVAPARLGVALAILAIDVAIGLRWLHGRGENKKLSVAPKESSVSNEEDSAAVAHRMLWRRSRLIMVGRLLWQHARQSVWLTLAVFILGFPISFAILMPLGFFADPVGDRSIYFVLPICVGIWASLMGATVFLPDQTRQQYRFFTEHNVPPRFVWLTRHLCWLLLLIVTTLLLHNIWNASVLHVVTLSLPLLMAVAFSIGQWCSMFIRSGIMAGFVSVVLSAFSLVWLLLMQKLQVPLWFSVMPIPLGLFFATWLRAPDWIRENTTWRARFRAVTTSILGPAIVLVAVPVFRVNQIPDYQPGFDVGNYLVELQADLHIGSNGAELFRAAADSWVRSESGKLDLKRPFTDAHAKWLEANRTAIELTLKASEQQPCMFTDPRTATELPHLRDGSILISLLVISAHQMEHDGKPDEALERYFAAIRVAGQLAPATPGSMTILQLRRIFAEITQWAALPNQTAERIRNARERLQALDSNILQIDQRLKFKYLLARKSFLAGEGMSPFWKPSSEQEKSEHWWELLWGKLMPWENYRAARALNMVTADDLQLLSFIPQILKNQNTEAGGAPLVYIVSQNRYTVADPPADLSTQIERRSWTEAEKKDFWARIERLSWLKTTVPNFTVYGSFGMEFMGELVEFEALRRATVLILAIEEYRLDRAGELPKGLNDLVPSYLERLPVDPYSASEYRYFPAGLPIDLNEVARRMDPTIDFVPPTSEPVPSGGPAEQNLLGPTITKQMVLEEVNRYAYHGELELNTPCVWCTAPGMWARADTRWGFDSNGPALPKAATIFSYYYLHSDGKEYPIPPDYSLWGRGWWFPIPPAKTE